MPDKPEVRPIPPRRPGRGRPSRQAGNPPTAWAGMGPAPELRRKLGLVTD